MKTVKILALLSLAMLPGLVGAQATNILTPPTTTITTVGGVVGLFCKAINWLFTFLILMTIIFVIWAAWTYLRAGGDPGKVSEAGNRLLYAAVAVAVALLAKGLPLLVANIIDSSWSQTTC